MYSATGGAWSYGSRITFSFVPDGTNIGGSPSTLYQSLTAIFPNQNVWQTQFLKAAAAWEQVANINLAWVPDAGGDLGALAHQQGDPRFGDIRISAIPLSSGTLGTTFSPPPINGGSAAGDIIMNSTTMWHIGSAIDLETVAIHELGHALGMNHSQISTAVMYAYYNGVKQQLTTDDVSGIDSIYGVRQYDGFSSGPYGNSAYYYATPLNGFMNSDDQVALPWPLTLTTTGQSQWFWVTAPSTTTGSMTVIAQAKGFSMLSPQVTVYDFSYNTLGQAGAPNLGSIAWLPNVPVNPGQGYFIRVNGFGEGSMVGAFGFQVNFGSVKLPPMPIYEPYIAAQPDQGGGSQAMQTLTSAHDLVQVGDTVGWGDNLTLPGLGTVDVPPPVESRLPTPRPLAWQGFLMGPTSDSVSPGGSSKALLFVAATHRARKPAYPQIRGIDRATSNSALQSIPSTILSGKMRSGGGLKT